MQTLKIPKESFVTLKKPNKSLIISFLAIIIANCITVFGFNFLDLKTKIIISLIIFSLILLIDVIVLYTQYYMFYYQAEYLNKVYQLIDINVDNLGQSISDLKTENTEIRNSVNINNEKIEMLKSKISWFFSILVYIFYIFYYFSNRI